jgi:hypothetical protein
VCACETKRKEKSGSALPNAARISSVTERIASEIFVAREQLAVKGMASM